MKNILKKLSLCAIALVSIVPASFGQAKKPTIMVVPADTWCTANGYMVETTNQGRTTRTPDYERALQENMDLSNTLIKFGELMSEQGMPVKDLSAAIKNVNRSAAEDEMTTSRTSGATLAETPLERLLTRAKADIIVELAWRVNETGPKRSVTYSLKGRDAYTDKQIAAAEGTGAASFSAEIPVLIEEAVIEKMDGFTSQLQAHFDDMVENGREVVLNIRVFDNESGMTLEDEVGDEELTDVIEGWVNANTVKNRFNLTDASENIMRFEQVRIPLYKENGAAMDTRAFANNLRKFLAKAPYNITAKVLTKGLGRADVVLGEK